jgi:hypothetical protein
VKRLSKIRKPGDKTYAVHERINARRLPPNTLTIFEIIITDKEPKSIGIRRIPKTEYPKTDFIRKAIQPIKGGTVALPKVK